MNIVKENYAWDNKYLNIIHVKITFDNSFKNLFKHGKCKYINQSKDLLLKLKKYSISNTLL